MKAAQWETNGKDYDLVSIPLVGILYRSTSARAQRSIIYEVWTVCSIQE